MLAHNSKHTERALCKARGGVGNLKIQSLFKG